MATSISLGNTLYGYFAYNIIYSFLQSTGFYTNTLKTTGFMEKIGRADHLKPI